MKGDGDPDDWILDAIQGYIEKGMVTSFVLIAEFTDEDGDTRLLADSMTDQRCHRTMGLLSWGLAVEQAKAQDVWREEDK